MTEEKLVLILGERGWLTPAIRKVGGGGGGGWEKTKKKIRQGKRTRTKFEKNSHAPAQSCTRNGRKQIMQAESPPSHPFHHFSTGLSLKCVMTICYSAGRRGGGGGGSEVGN